jgi:N-acetylneuraminate synthase
MKKTIIIAEAGVNHNGCISTAQDMVRMAAKAGADFIKFQTFKSELLASPEAKPANYQKEQVAEDSQLEMLKKLELNEEAHNILFECCKKNKIGFLSSPFDLESISLLGHMAVEYIKIPSGEITNLPYLRAVAELKKKTILSTGMSTLEEVDEAIDVLVKYGVSKRHLTLLHCTSEYPCPFEDVNLKAILTLKDKFGLPVGYSDHTAGIEVSLAAVTLGAVIIEKHFTLDKNLPGPDHKASLDVKELTSMIAAIRNIEKAMGDGIKKPSDSECNNIIPARKSIFLSKNVKKGETFKEQHLISLRPGDGVSPMMWDKVLGNKAKEDLPAGHKLRWKDIN